MVCAQCAMWICGSWKFWNMRHLFFFCFLIQWRIVLQCKNNVITNDSFMKKKSLLNICHKCFDYFVHPQQKFLSILHCIHLLLLHVFFVFLNSTTQSFSSLGLTTFQSAASTDGALPHEKAHFAFALHEGRLKGPFNQPNGTIDERAPRKTR